MKLCYRNSPLVGRLVGSGERALRNILFIATVTYEELHTVIAEAEGVLYSKPLC